MSLNSSHKSCPEYDWLKLLLHTGKSGTIFPCIASSSASQFTLEGSLTMQRLISPLGPDWSQYTIPPRHPSTTANPEHPFEGGSKTPLILPSGMPSNISQIIRNDSLISSILTQTRAWISPEFSTVILGIIRSYGGKGFWMRQSKPIPLARATKPTTPSALASSIDSTPASLTLSSREGFSSYMMKIPLLKTG